MHSINLPFKQIDTYGDNTFWDSTSNEGDIKLIEFIPKVTPYILDSSINKTSTPSFIEVISI
jgi:hypothetical protein